MTEQDPPVDPGKITPYTRKLANAELNAWIALAYAEGDEVPAAEEELSRAKRRRLFAQDLEG